MWTIFIANMYLLQDPQVSLFKFGHMKVNVIDLRSGKNTLVNCSKLIILLVLTFLLFITIPLYVFNKLSSSLDSLKIIINGSNPPGKIIDALGRVEHCDLYSGKWVPYQKGPYYTNTTKCVIDDRQNCMKFGRPDVDFMKWRWKPDDCDLPLFDAAQFLQLVRGKSMAFVGDSVSRNQMQSLVCMLASVVYPMDASYVQDTRFRRWHFLDYNFTIAALWSTNLIKSCDADPNGYSLNSLMNLYLDEVDEAWANQIENFDYVIISAGQWFSRPFMYYENGMLIGCNMCHKKNITSLSRYYGYRKAFRTAFRTLLRLQNFKGITILRTFSPPHFENGDWDKGGNCPRTRPFTKQEMRLDEYILEFYLTQMEELRAAEREGRERGLKFRLIDTTELMLLRPDGHPNHHGHWPHENVSVADCVHWCMPGPVDTWNEFLLQMLKMDGKGWIS